MLKGWISKKDKQGNILHFNPKPVYIYSYKERVEIKNYLDSISSKKKLKHYNNTHEHSFRQFNSFGIDRMVCSKCNHVELL